MSTIINPQPELQNEELQVSQPQQEKLQEPEQINPIILLKQPQLFKETFAKITKSAQQLFKNKDLEKGLVLLNKAIDMLDLGKNILKDSVSKYTKLSIFVNLAYGYQNLRKLQKASRFCERAREELDRLISLAKNEETSIEKYLKLSKFLVTLKFQHCAIVSQLQQHQKALEMCKSTLPQLKQQLQTMLKYLRQSSSSKLLQKKNGETVQFSRHVQKFAQGLLVDLLNFLNEPLKKFHFYYWEKNPELNEEQIRKKFIPSNVEVKNECKRSILGVNKASSWMDEFNIGSIMHMSMVTTEDFETTFPMEQYYFKDKLYQIVILCSLSYFTMATQIRFLQPSKQKQGSSKQTSERIVSPNNSQIQSQSGITQQSSKMQKSEPQPSKSQSAEVILRKYGYEQRSEMFKLSQLYHLRAIQMVSRHIQSVIPYLIHIIKSFDKHYLKKKELEPIAAINEESQMSLLNQSAQEYLPEEKIYNDYMKKGQEKGKNQEPMDELLLQSQDNHRSIVMSRNKSDQKSGQHKLEGLDEVKNVLDFNAIDNQESLHVPESNLNPGNSKFKKSLSKIVEDPKLESQIHLYSRAQDQQNEAHQQNQIVSGEYLKSKKTMQSAKSPKKSKNDTKRTKSKSKLNLIKSRQKEKSSTFKNSQKSKPKNIYTYRSSNEDRNDKRSVSKSHYQSNKMAATSSGQEMMIKKYHSPELLTINESKKRLKTHLSDKSREKLLKKFIGIPTSQYESDQKPSVKGAKKTKNSDKKGKDEAQQKKKQSKYFTTFDGQKQYRIKHESTTHIKVLYKKKNPHEAN